MSRGTQLFSVRARVRSTSACSERPNSASRASLSRCALLAAARRPARPGAPSAARSCRCRRPALGLRGGVGRRFLHAAPTSRRAAALSSSSRFGCASQPGADARQLVDAGVAVAVAQHASRAGRALASTCRWRCQQVAQHVVEAAAHGRWPPAPAIRRGRTRPAGRRRSGRAGSRGGLPTRSRCISRAQAGQARAPGASSKATGSRGVGSAPAASRQAL